MALDTTVRSFKALLRPKIHNPARHGSNTKEAYSALARKINISSGDRGAASKVARESLHSDNAGLGSRTQSDREEHICNVRPDWEALVTKQILRMDTMTGLRHGLHTEKIKGDACLSPSFHAMLRWSSYSETLWAYPLGAMGGGVDRSHSGSDCGYNSKPVVREETPFTAPVKVVATGAL
ncbi:hypothetical protein JB92DRAFT_2836257 [Gautieria morchelliformis]|nr:hypothetical protein JB92DRAFT_2836257 [Gautieria morchelliformis]